MEQEATTAVAGDGKEILVAPPESAIVPNIEPTQRQLAEFILPYAQKAFHDSLEHLPHQVSQENGLTRAKGQDYSLICQQAEGNTIFSVIALDEREEILRTRNGILEMVNGVTTADREKWQAIGAKLERLEKQSEGQNGQKTQNGQNPQKQPERQIVL